MLNLTVLLQLTPFSSAELHPDYCTVTILGSCILTVSMTRNRRTHRMLFAPLCGLHSMISNGCYCYYKRISSTPLAEDLQILYQWHP